MVRLDEVTDLMDQMLKVEIFQPSEKLEMIKDRGKTILDPNLIMDARHRICREDLSVSPTKFSVLTEAKRLLSEEERRELWLKKEEEFLEKELKKFEKELHKSRPKYSRLYACHKRNYVPSDDDDFWRTSRRAKEKTTKKIGNARRTNVATIPTLNKRIIVSGTSSKLKNETNQIKTESDVPRFGSIKVTIKDKANFESDKQNLSILRKCFDVLKRNAIEERRVREIQTKIQQNKSLRLTRKYYNIWRAYAENAKKMKQKLKEEQEITEEQKIEIFINAITEKQKELMKCGKVRARDGNSIVDSPSDAEIKKKNIYSKHIIVEPPAQSRLNAQKRIIEKQRAKLAEQNRIIEELKLKQVQDEISRSGKETVNVAKETFTHCGQGTRRTMIQLMRQAGYRDESLIIPQRVPSPPKFLARMEARAEARRERTRLAKEARRKKFEEQKRKEETARRDEEQEKRRLQQEALREARRLREEQERNRLREIEESKRLKKIAEDFYRKYLLRRYVMNPLKILVEQKNIDIKKAEEHYKESLKRKVFTTLRIEMEEQHRIKEEIAASFYKRNLLSKMIKKWKQVTRENNLQYQVAKDFYDMNLLDKYFKLWQIITVECKVQYQKNVELAVHHYESKLKLRCFSVWKKYPKSAADIKESEKRKNELRQIVQKMIPDFDPKQRGVAIED